LVKQITNTIKQLMIFLNAFKHFKAWRSRACVLRFPLLDDRSTTSTRASACCITPRTHLSAGFCRRICLWR